MTFLRRRQLKYFGTFGIFILVATLCTLWFTHSIEQAFMRQVNELHSLAEVEVQAVQTQYFFKRQVQEWKNILMRGHVQADFEKYLVLFEQESLSTQGSATLLYERLQDKSEIKPLAKQFLNQHRDLFDQYQATINVFKDSGFDSKYTDRIVRGIDRKPTLLLDDIVNNLAVDIQNKRDTISKELTVYVATYGSFIALFLGMFALVCFHFISALIRSTLTDKTTKIGNRDYFVNLVKDAIKFRTPATVGLLDINNFRLINEAFGSAGGDDYLCKIAEKISLSLAKGETVCRVGGDSLGIILHEKDSESALKRMEHIKFEIARCEYCNNDIHLSCTASIGVVCMHQAIGSNSEQLLNNLYASLQEAKEKGPNTIVTYSKNEASVKQRRSQMQTVSDINLALDEERLVLFGQEILNLNTDAGHFYYEVLLRIKDRSGEYILPEEFIEAAERFNIMGKIDRHIIALVVNCLLTKGVKSASYSVNLSASTLSDKKFIKLIQNLFDNPSLDHKKLSFEVTETDVVKNFAVANEVIRTLKSYGCKIALDDFGAGMSSYGYLASLDIDIIKIDGSLVRHIKKKLANQSIIKSIVSLARDLQIKTVAEFVETEEEFLLLKDIGVDFLQGFYIERPKLLFDPVRDSIVTETKVENITDSIKENLIVSVANK